MNDGLRRLKVLAEVVLPAVKKEEFDLRNWHCGTTACAVGHTCMYKPFQEEGLCMVKEGLCMVKKIGETKLGFLYPLYEGAADISAAEEFFELTYSEARGLFYKSQYQQENPTVNDVIMKIQEVIKRKEDEERLKQISKTG